MNWPSTLQRTTLWHYYCQMADLVGLMSLDFNLLPIYYELQKIENHFICLFVDTASGVETSIRLMMTENDLWVSLLIFSIIQDYKWKYFPSVEDTPQTQNLNLEVMRWQFASKISFVLLLATFNGMRISTNSVLMLIEEVSESEKDIISSGLFLELVFNFMAFHETIK